jgi:hypothetical protein
VSQAAVSGYDRGAMPRPGRSALRLVALAALCGSAAAQDSVVELGYDVRYGPLPILAMEVRSEVDGDRYRATSTVRTKGLIDKLYHWQSTSESRGRREGLALRPEWHRSDGLYRSERRTVAIDYPLDGPVRAVVTPRPERKHDVVPDDLQQATVDPLTASLLTVGTACRGLVPVFDGRRRYDLRLEELAPATVPRSRGALFVGRARRCRATVEARAGHWRDDPRDSDTPTTLDYWIASPAERVPPVPVYLELSGARGTLGIVLTSARVPDVLETGGAPSS